MKCSARYVLGVLSLMIAVPLTANAAPPPLPPGSWYNWTALYVGGNVGGGWGNTSSNGTDVAGPRTATFSSSANSSGWLGGGQVGGIFEFAERWVIGIEADGDAAKISGTSSGCSTFANGVVRGCGTDTAQLGDFGTVRGRFGYAFGNLLFYGTGGWAWGNSSGNHTTTCVSSLTAPVALCPGASTAFSGGAASFSDSLTGWTAGAGLEWGFLRNWTARVEYLHVQFDNVSTGFSTTVTTGRGTTSVVTSTASNNGFDIVRVGLNFLFR
ncbi:MAG TPA: outer membrane beta-barrel protein [Burkholderiaceae bacterium]|nr:outer membrane beta-barrel protein [Burkholderiaceae bacterium]